jgi:hypothetical protein
MNTTNLMAVQDGGGKLIMMDGTIWIINPEDIKNTSSWEPPCSIQIQEESGAQEYDYQILNQDTGVSAPAKRRR